jgi:hypothetical protein
LGWQMICASRKVSQISPLPSSFLRVLLAAAAVLIARSRTLPVMEQSSMISTETLFFPHSYRNGESYAKKRAMKEPCLTISHYKIRQVFSTESRVKRSKRNELAQEENLKRESLVQTNNTREERPKFVARTPPHEPRSCL